jgi:hypothetical protein
VLSVEALASSIEVTQRGPDDVYEVEGVPAGFLSIGYPFWQVLAALIGSGGVRWSRNGTETDIALPGWINLKWRDLSWWLRFRP